MEERLTKRQKRQLRKERKQEERVKRQKDQKRKNSIKWAIIFVIIAVAIYGMYKFLTAGIPNVTNSHDVITQEDNVKGNTNSSVTLIEYGDFQCPACATYHSLVSQIAQEYGGRIQIAFRNFPLRRIHSNAQISSQAAEAAGKQGKFWEMHDMLYVNQNEWAGERNPESIFEEYAKALDLDVDIFTADLKSSEVEEKINRDIALGNAAGINSTPSFVVNGSLIKSPGSLEEFRTIIDGALASVPLPENESSQYHAHADFLVYINGEKVDFSVPKYQSTDENHLDDYVHIHDQNGDIMHFHSEDTGIGEFFTSIGFGLTDSCITTDDGQEYCTDDENELALYVNGQKNEQISTFVPRDLDRLLIYFGPKNNSLLQTYLQAVPDEACIYSEKCPDRGSPPDEDCVGGLGTGCDQGSED